jgi:hypothetical protein
MSPSGLVRIRAVIPPAGPAVPVQTVLAPTSKSMAFLVMTAPLLLLLLWPVAATLTSSGVTGSMPLYSRIRISDPIAAALNRTVTLFAPAGLGRMFFA